MLIHVFIQHLLSYHGFLVTCHRLSDGFMLYNGTKYHSYIFAAFSKKNRITALWKYLVSISTWFIIDMLNTIIIVLLPLFFNYKTPERQSQWKQSRCIQEPVIQPCFIAAARLRHPDSLPCFVAISNRLVNKYYVRQTGALNDQVKTDESISEEYSLQIHSPMKSLK